MILLFLARCLLAKEIMLFPFAVQNDFSLLCPSKFFHCFPCFFLDSDKSFSSDHFWRKINTTTCVNKLWFFDNGKMFLVTFVFLIIWQQFNFLHSTFFFPDFPFVWLFAMLVRLCQNLFFLHPLFSSRTRYTLTQGWTSISIIFLRVLSFFHV